MWGSHGHHGEWAVVETKRGSRNSCKLQLLLLLVGLRLRLQLGLWFTYPRHSVFAMYAYIDLPYPNVGKYGSPMGCLGIAPGPPQRPNPSPVDPPAPGIFQVEDLRDQMMLKGIPVHYPASEALAERLERKPGVVAQSVASRGVPSV